MAAATGTYQSGTQDGGGGGDESAYLAYECECLQVALREGVRARRNRTWSAEQFAWHKARIRDEVSTYCRIWHYWRHYTDPKGGRKPLTKEEIKRCYEIMDGSGLRHRPHPAQGRDFGDRGLEVEMPLAYYGMGTVFRRVIAQRERTWLSEQFNWTKARKTVVIDIVWICWHRRTEDGLTPRNFKRWLQEGVTWKSFKHWILTWETTTKYAQTGFSPSSSFTAARSPDTASPIYPERAIRPLPRNRLKSKLSPEQASTIQFPPEPPPISPTLSFNIPDTSAPSQHRRLTNGHSHHEHDHDVDDHDYDYDHCHHRHGQRVLHHGCTCHEDADSGEDEVEFDHPDYRYPPAPMTNGTAVKPVDSLQRRLVEASRASGKSPPSGSTASSADGYESFENTSNKKKRKIPLSGASSMHQSSLSAELANMGISNTHTDDISVHGMTVAELEQYGAQAAHASMAASGTGISGAGRGRFGRQDARHRKPLAHAVNTSNLHNSRHANGTARGGDQAASGVENTNTGGIISQAIKTAAEQGPLTPAVKGRENVSRPLQSAASLCTSTTPKTQFTFTCESDSATKMVDQHAAHAAPYGTPTPQRHASTPGKSTPGTQTTPGHRGGHPPNNTARPPLPLSNHAPSAGLHQPQPQHQQPAPPPKPRPRRNPTREYALQAAQRRKNQQYQNYHHPPKPDDMYICMFCEYEDIYGVPPYALIRQYEIKDRKERKKAAEKRRLLEKAKMKGRKNKKGAKGKNNAANNAANPPPPAHPQNYDPNMPPPDGEEFDDDDDEEYDGDDYDPTGEDEQYDDEGHYPPPAPASTPAMPMLEKAPG